MGVGFGPNPLYVPAEALVTPCVAPLDNSFRLQPVKTFFLTSPSTYKKYSAVLHLYITCKLYQNKRNNLIIFSPTTHSKRWKNLFYSGTKPANFSRCGKKTARTFTEYK